MQTRGLRSFVQDLLQHSIRPPARRAARAGAVALLLSPLAAGGFTLPPDFGPPGWDRTPAAVLDSPRPGEPLVWLGRVEGFSFRERGERLVLVWRCRWMPFARPGPAALDSRPVAALPPAEGRFHFEVVTGTLTVAEARGLGEDIAAETHYALVAGTLVEVVAGRQGPEIVLQTRKFEVHDDLVRLLPGA